MINPFQELTPEQREWLESEKDHFDVVAQSVAGGGERAREEVISHLSDIYDRIARGDHRIAQASCIGISEAIFRGTDGYRSAFSLYLNWQDLTGANPATLLRELTDRSIDAGGPRAPKAEARLDEEQVREIQTLRAEEEAEQVAMAIATVLGSDLTPVDVFNALADALNEFSNTNALERFKPQPFEPHQPEYLPLWLPAALLKYKKQRGVEDEGE